MMPAIVEQGSLLVQHTEAIYFLRKHIIEAA